MRRRERRAPEPGRAGERDPHPQRAGQHSHDRLPPTRPGVIGAEWEDSWDDRRVDEALRRGTWRWVGKAPGKLWSTVWRTAGGCGGGQPTARVSPGHPALMQSSVPISQDRSWWSGRTTRIPATGWLRCPKQSCRPMLRTPSGSALNADGLQTAPARPSPSICLRGSPPRPDRQCTIRQACILRIATPAASPDSCQPRPARRRSVERAGRAPHQGRDREHAR